MEVAALMAMALRASISLMVITLGLRLSLIDMTYVLRRTGLLLRSILSMNVLMPLLAGVLVISFDLHPAVKVALVMLSVSPVPPLLPMKELKAGLGSGFTFSLLATEAALAILFVPIGVEVFDTAFPTQTSVSPAAVAAVVLITVLAPLGVGLLVRRQSPAFAERIVKPLTIVATLLLAASLIPILLIATPAALSLVGNGTLTVIVAFILAGLATGHLLGGPEPKNRTVLALATASRHPAVALTIAGPSFPEEKLVLAAVLLYLIVNAIVSIPYLVWRRGHDKSQTNHVVLSELTVLVKHHRQ